MWFEDVESLMVACDNNQNEPQKYNNIPQKTGASMIQTIVPKLGPKYGQKRTAHVNKKWSVAALPPTFYLSIDSPALFILGNLLDPFLIYVLP